MFFYFFFVVSSCVLCVKVMCEPIASSSVIYGMLMFHSHVSKQSKP